MQPLLRVRSLLPFGGAWRGVSSTSCAWPAVCGAYLTWCVCGCVCGCVCVWLAVPAPDVEHTVQPSPYVGALPLVTMLGKVPPTDIASLQVGAATPTRVQWCAMCSHLRVAAVAMCVCVCVCV